ncbi:RNA-directed DNA polymerase [Salinisphaera shabanensis T35B1]
MLANLAVRPLDEQLDKFARGRGLVYTRYADDMTFSTTDKDFTREDAAKVVEYAIRCIEKEGLRLHAAKTQVVPPGARRLVLGLQVDGAKPRLTREYRNNLRQHAYMLGTKSIPPSEHASARGFRSVFSMRRHIEGKIEHARQVEQDFAAEITGKLKDVDWPV